MTTTTNDRNGQQVQQECCQTHDGPHVHGCTRPRQDDGRTHGGECRVAVVEVDRATATLAAAALTARAQQLTAGGLRGLAQQYTEAAQVLAAGVAR